MTPPARPRRPLALAALAALAAGTACWTSGAGPAAAAAGATDPTAPCPTRLIGLVRDADSLAPLPGATVVVETAAGSVAALITDAAGRFEAPAASPPARLRIYYGDRVAEHRLAACQVPLRIGLHLQ